MRDKCFPIPPRGPWFYKPTGGEEATSLGAQMDFSLGHRMGLGHSSRPADQISHNWDSCRNLRGRAISNFSSKSLQGSQFPQMFSSVSSNGCLEANILPQKQFLSMSELFFLFVCLCPCQSACVRVCVCMWCHLTEDICTGMFECRPDAPTIQSNDKGSLWRDGERSDMWSISHTYRGKIKVVSLAGPLPCKLTRQGTFPSSVG